MVAIFFILQFLYYTMIELFLDTTVNHIMMNLLLKCCNCLDVYTTEDFKYTELSAGDVISFDVIKLVARHIRQRLWMYAYINVTNHLPTRDIFESDVWGSWYEQIYSFLAGKFWDERLKLMKINNTPV